MTVKEIMIKCITLCNLKATPPNSIDWIALASNKEIQDEYDYWNEETQYKNPQVFLNKLTGDIL